MAELPGYILRIQKDELERQLFGKNSLYVGLRRDWSKGLIVLFVKKDMFVGRGMVAGFVLIDRLDEQEKRACLENNWSGKLLFERIERFVPPLLVQSTPAAGLNQLALHGAIISGSAISLIEGLVNSRIIS